MKVKSILITSFLTFFTAISGFSQSGDSDFLRSVGKIYVVVGVILAIFIGIILFLIFLDRRLTKLEHQIKENE